MGYYGRGQNFKGEGGQSSWEEVALLKEAGGVNVSRKIKKLGFLRFSFF